MQCEHPNEELVAQAIKDRHDQAFIATKFGIAYDEAETAKDLPTGFGFSLRINATPKYARKALDGSLKR